MRRDAARYAAEPLVEARKREQKQVAPREQHLPCRMLIIFMEVLIMCSIMGYCSDGAAFELFKKEFDKTVSRGPDDSKIIDTGKGLLGFHRLAIMGLHPE